MTDLQRGLVFRVNMLNLAISVVQNCSQVLQYDSVDVPS